MLASAGLLDLLAQAGQVGDGLHPTGGDLGQVGRVLGSELVEVTGRHLAEPGLIELTVLISAEAADASSAAHGLFTERYDNAVTGLAALLRRAVDSGEFPPGTDCAALARECIAVSDGLQLQWVLSGGKLDLVGAVRAHLDRLAHTLTGAGLDPSP